MATLVISGSRCINKYTILVSAIEESGFTFDKIVEGGAKGVDELAIEYGLRNNIPVETVPADWDRNRYLAGMFRNLKMLEMADMVLCVWDGRSTGTKHMIDITRKTSKPLYIRRLRCFGNSCSQD